MLLLWIGSRSRHRGRRHIPRSSWGRCAGRPLLHRLHLTSNFWRDGALLHELLDPLMLVHRCLGLLLSIQWRSPQLSRLPHHRHDVLRVELTALSLDGVHRHLQLLGCEAVGKLDGLSRLLLLLHLLLQHGELLHVDALVRTSSGSGLSHCRGTGIATATLGLSSRLEALKCRSLLMWWQTLDRSDSRVVREEGELQSRRVLSDRRRHVGRGRGRNPCRSSSS